MSKIGGNINFQSWTKLVSISMIIVQICKFDFVDFAITNYKTDFSITSKRGKNLLFFVVLNKKKDSLKIFEKLILLNVDYRVMDAGGVGLFEFCLLNKQQRLAQFLIDRDAPYIQSQVSQSQVKLSQKNKLKKITETLVKMQNLNKSQKSQFQSLSQDSNSLSNTKLEESNSIQFNSTICNILHTKYLLVNSIKESRE